MGIRIYAIPRGGVTAAYLLLRYSSLFGIVSHPQDADIFFDDIIDSGVTRAEYAKRFPGTPFYALIDKSNSNSEYADQWVTFPWEKADGTQSHDDSIVGTLTNRIRASGKPFFANDNVSEFLFDAEKPAFQAEIEKRAEHLLRGLLIDIDSDHNTVGTAHRMAKMFVNEVFRGRYTPCPSMVKFPNVKKLDEMYVTGPITLRSACSHHLVPIMGECWIGIIPGKYLPGLSKFNRIVDWFASRPQIQEELAVQIADYLEAELSPAGVAVIIKATHMCMTWRGVREPMDAKMTTSIMRGAFRLEHDTRDEFLTLVSLKR
jgi:GTP cyclohydrolase I